MQALQRKPELNQMFYNLAWSHGRKPLMILNGEIMKMDIIASTILSGSLTNSNPSEIKLCVKIYDLKECQKYNFSLQSENILTCWDLIDSVNSLQLDDNIYDVTEIDLVDEKTISLRINKVY